MSSIVFLLCLLSAVRSVDLRASQRRVRDDDYTIEELFQTNKGDWKDNSDVTYDTRYPGNSKPYSQYSNLILIHSLLIRKVHIPRLHQSWSIFTSHPFVLSNQKEVFPFQK